MPQNSQTQDNNAVNASTQLQTNPSAETPKKLSSWQNIFKGSSIGAVEVAIDHPLWVIKTRIQNKKNFTLNPRILYRGIGPNMASMMPITAIQVTATSMLENTFPIASNDKSLASEFQKVTCAFAGGAISATVSTGTELAMTHMAENRGFVSTVKWLAQQHGITRINTGFIGTATRDGLFTIGFMKAPKIVERGLSHYFPQYQKANAALSGPIAGIFSAIASHPFDAIKTRQQKVAHQKKLSFGAATKGIIQQDGFFALYKGLIPRAMRVVSAITIMDKVSKEMDEYFKKPR